MIITYALVILITCTISLIIGFNKVLWSISFIFLLSIPIELFKLQLISHLLYTGMSLLLIKHIIEELFKSRKYKFLYWCYKNFSNDKKFIEDLVLFRPFCEEVTIRLFGRIYTGNSLSTQFHKQIKFIWYVANNEIVVNMVGISKCFVCSQEHTDSIDDCRDLKDDYNIREKRFHLFTKSGSENNSLFDCVLKYYLYNEKNNITNKIEELLNNQNIWAKDEKAGLMKLNNDMYNRSIS